MIAYVSGKLVSKDPETVIIDVNGIGYRVMIPTSTYDALPETGKSVKLHTFHYLREDAEALYGFASEAEQAVFETMTGVSRVGPKLALAALSTMTPRELRDHVMEGDADRLTNISGVGSKTASRLIVELQDRFQDLDVFQGSAPISGGSQARAEARQDALKALTEMGLSRAEAERNLRKVLRDHPGLQDSGELTRLALTEGK